MHREPSRYQLDALPARARRPFATLAAVAALVTGSSCSPVAGPVNPLRAREALATALDGWKKGDAPSLFRDASPPMTVQDLDWMGGAKLLGYQIDGDGKEAGASLLLPARLQLKTPQGKAVEKKVTYIVGTSPIVTVFRGFP